MDITDVDFCFKMNCTEFYKFISIGPKQFGRADNHRSNELRKRERESEVLRYLWTLQILILFQNESPIYQHCTETHSIVDKHRSMNLERMKFLDVYGHCRY
jgi:hypothetical protein